jgi:hypothetical protein
MSECQDWFGVKMTFVLALDQMNEQGDHNRVIEERVILLQAEDFDAALAAGEAAAELYAKENVWPNFRGQVVSTRYLGACDVFKIGAAPSAGTEVYSKLYYVDANVTDGQIIDRFFGTSQEQCSDHADEFEPDFEAVVQGKVSK